MLKTVGPFVILTIITILGCENNVAEDQIDQLEDCTKVETYYSESVLPIMEESCTICHSGNAPSGGLGLDSYSSVRSSMAATLDIIACLSVLRNPLPFIPLAATVADFIFALRSAAAAAIFNSGIHSCYNSWEWPRW